MSEILSYGPWAATVVGALAAYFIALRIYRWYGFRDVTVYEYQRGILFHKGKLKRVLTAGRYRIASQFESIQAVDMRKSLITLPGQDILTRDNVNIKLTLSGYYQVTDPVVATVEQGLFQVHLHNLVQIELRRIVNTLTIDELLAKKGELDDSLQAALAPQGESLGLELTGFAVRDVLLPANLKRAFAGLMEAQKEAQRRLEKARGEQAVLRSLANSARVYENNPMLVQARLIQALSEGNNSIVFNGGEGLTVQPVKPAK